MKFYVYAHINPVTLVPFYIGKGIGERLNDTQGRNRFWHNTVNKYGFNATKLVEDLSELESFEVEKQYIKKYELRSNGGILVNLTYGGSGGNTISEHNREGFLVKCRDGKLGKLNPNFGKKTWSFSNSFSKATKEKMSIARLGKKLNPEVKIKVLEGLKKAAKVALENRTHKVECLETFKVWNNRNECAAHLGISIDTFKQRILRNKLIKGNYLQLIKK